MPEDRLRKRRQALWIEMLNDLDQCRRVELLEPVVAISERAMEQLNSFDSLTSYLVQP